VEEIHAKIGLPDMVYNGSNFHAVDRYLHSKRLILQRLYNGFFEGKRIVPLSEQRTGLWEVLHADMSDLLFRDMQEIIRPIK
jgi:hypothetical protein